MAKPPYQPDTSESVQTNINRSMDADFDVLAVENLVYDGSALQRMKSNTSGEVIVGVSSDMEGGGKIEVGTTAVEVTFSGTTKNIIIRADSLNAGRLFVGKSNVTNLGANALYFLDAGEVLTLDYDDTDNSVYVVSDTAAQNVWKGALL